MDNIVTIGGETYTVTGGGSRLTSTTITIDGTVYNIQDANDYYTVEDVRKITEVPLTKLHVGDQCYSKLDKKNYIYNGTEWVALQTDLNDLFSSGETATTTALFLEED